MRRRTPTNSPARKLRRVLVFGTFDLLHPGHKNFLHQAKRRGSHLIVAIGRDHIVKKIKGRPTSQTERMRQRAVAALQQVDRAILAPRDPRQRFQFIRRLHPHVIALGYDQTHYTEHLEQDLEHHGILARVVRLRSFHPARYKTSLIRQREQADRTKLHKQPGKTD
jgi:FAD synthetase